MKLKDIAKEAGVSISTVSRVINNKMPCAASPEVREKILEIVKKNGYSPNIAAKQLKLGENSNIGTAKSIACVFSRTSLKDSFFAQLLRSITDFVKFNNCIIKYTLSTFDMNKATIVDIIKNDNLDGIVILGRCDIEFINELYHYVPNIVCTGLQPIDTKGDESFSFDQVYCDSYLMGVSAMEYLFSIGHKKIAYVGETENDKRFLAYRKVLKDNGIELEKENYVNIILSVKGGYEGTKKLLEKNPNITAIFCANDSTAMGTMRACKEIGLNIPEDISIIGADDLELTKYLTPTLTTIKAPIGEIGRIGITILFSRIEKKHKSSVNVSLPFTLKERESSTKKLMR